MVPNGLGGSYVGSFTTYRMCLHLQMHHPGSVAEAYQRANRNLKME